MDSIQSRIDESKRGGASGEMTIRLALCDGLAAVGVKCYVARSDSEFEREGKSLDKYVLIFLDPWTWAARGWKMKPFLLGHEQKLYILDFFGGDGHPALNPTVPLQRHLTAYPVHPRNTFLGYFLPDAAPVRGKRKKAGVIWGKDPKYYQGKQSFLTKVASVAPLVSTAPQSA